ncbi:uncharacterized protein TNCV_3062941 [Trichonephila clavipes]|nr:uncharacterized protein TNCV_3062941 [Trichonephila clavipes]
MVVLNEVLTEFLDDIPLTAIQRLWFQYEMGLRRIPVILYVIGWISHTPAVGSYVKVLFYGLHVLQSYIIGLFFLWDHLKELVYRDVGTTQMDLITRLHAACTLVAPAELRRVMTAIPRRAQACLDMPGGHFEHLP